MENNGPDSDSAPSPDVLLSETADRYRIKGLIIINRETGKPESYKALSRDEIDMPGYVESIERGYLGTQWSTERTSRAEWSVQGEITRASRLDPTGMRTDEQVEEQAKEGHGHVRPLYSNGRQIWAKCGGPKICPVCKHEQTLYGATQED